MNWWRSIALLILTVALPAGCVYVPPYYFDDPVSPSPWLYPVEPYPPRDYRFHQRPDPYLYHRRHLGHRSYPDREFDSGQPGYRPSTEDKERVVPPSKTEVPTPEKGTEARTDPKDIPTAAKGSKPGRVKVPFPPYNELDVSGLPSGSLAKDPTTGKVFRLP